VVCPILVSLGPGVVFGVKTGVNLGGSHGVLYGVGSLHLCE